MFVGADKTNWLAVVTKELAYDAREVARMDWIIQYCWEFIAHAMFMPLVSPWKSQSTYVLMKAQGIGLTLKSSLTLTLPPSIVVYSASCSRTQRLKKARIIPLVLETQNKKRRNASLLDRMWDLHRWGLLVTGRNKLSGLMQGHVILNYWKLFSTPGSKRL